MVKKQIIEFPHFTWIDIENPDATTMEDLGREHELHPLDISDTLSISHRSKVDIYPKYVFLVFLFPLYNRQNREIESSEINFFIGRNFLITIHKGNLTVFKDFFHTFHISPDLRDRYTDRSPERLVYESLHKMLMYIFPMIDHLIEDCDDIEREIFSGKERRLISEILMLRRNIIDFRKIMQVHKNVIKKSSFYFKESALYVMKKTDIYFDNLTNYAKEIWDTLENLKERIEALQATNESQISFRLSDIMRTLTVISVVMLPISSLAAIFSMDMINSTPLVGNPYGFWIVLAVMVVIVVSMVSYFRKKGWF